MQADRSHKQERKQDKIYISLLLLAMQIPYFFLKLYTYYAKNEERQLEI